jgi:site-specific recombinase XerD
MDGTVRGEEIRESLGTRNWEQAVELARKREMASAKPTEPDEPVRFEACAADFLADLQRRALSSSTISKYELLFRQMQDFADAKGIRYVREFDLPTVREFCGTWTQGNNTALKKLERLRAFFRYALESNWVGENPATKIRNPKVKVRPTMPFTSDEMVAILAACDQYPDCYGRTGQWNGRRLRAFVLLL